MIEMGNTHTDTHAYEHTQIR